MCTINEENDIEDLNLKFSRLKSKPVKSLLPGFCHKCKAKRPVLCLRKKDVYCKECFINATAHKFKILLGKHRLIRENDRILVPYDGGHRSAALMQFLKINKDDTNPRKLKYQPVILIVDKYCNCNIDSRINYLNRLEHEAKTYNFPIRVISLSDFISHKNIIYDSTTHLKIERNENVNTTDVRKLHEDTLKKCARELNCKFIFLPDAITDVAFNIFRDVSLGEGLASNAGFVDARSETVILRPLKLFDAKELALFNHFNGANTIFFEKQNGDNLEELLNSFIHNLQSEYPATVTTITRTADKLGSNDNKTCRTCQDELSVDKSIQFSQLISKGNCNDLNEIMERMSRTKSTCRTCSSHVT